MVKKIRLIEQESSAEELNTAEFQSKMLEYMRAMDWKLWEMLKIEQARAIRDGIMPAEVEPEAPTRETAKDFKPVVIDETK
jgi:hypothetical protein